MRNGIISTAGVAVFSLAIAAGLSPAASGASPKTTPVEQCAAKAIAAKRESWVCLGGTLVTTYSLATVSATDSTPWDIGNSVSASQITIDGLPGDYDTWCENGSVCTRTISDYISETKGNAAYGNTSGVIGSFDVVIRTNLNGRQPQWRVYWKRDSGPTLNFSSAYVRCAEDEIAIDSSCGTFFADGDDGSFTLGSLEVYSGYIYGNKLRDSNDYYAYVTGNFRPTGYPTYSMAALRTEQILCFGTGNCYFN